MLLPLNLKVSGKLGPTLEKEEIEVSAEQLPLQRTNSINNYGVSHDLLVSSAQSGKHRFVTHRLA
jgi:hypothetical protein